MLWVRIWRGVLRCLIVDSGWEDDTILMMTHLGYLTNILGTIAQCWENSAAVWIICARRWVLPRHLPATYGRVSRGRYWQSAQFNRFYANIQNKWTKLSLRFSSQPWLKLTLETLLLCEGTVMLEDTGPKTFSNELLADRSGVLSRDTSWELATILGECGAVIVPAAGHCSSKFLVVKHNTTLNTVILWSLATPRQASKWRSGEETSAGSVDIWNISCHVLRWS